ncbi:ABC-F family ATP-binding cassette domain-containing protein [Candidatus Liberibacter sp.]|uniref:ABC-F family ATP-binding cassette domain-containing protein n=1 Tax=Candidatus Liberibacter sp. TaxID=34022 RepID=UPI0015F5E14B|nr:ABC-F family ATP-binding cassette domain-containing protein [Candidatus Liberibacter sp.]MBA5724545.1 ABC-F family ATP-binding cassette domain-containing protein [Candidatus Liberibacter sp.]
MDFPILRLDHVNATIGGVDLLKESCLSVKPGERICLVGRNGSGKSTLLKIAAGFMEPQSGDVFLNTSARLGYLEQNPDFSGFSTIFDYIEHAKNDYQDCSYSLTSLLNHFNLTRNEKMSQLSVGKARCVAFIRIFILRPDILILDEPTNHLDFRTIHWLERELLNIKSALIFVSHDRRFLKTLSTTTIWLDRGTLHRLDKGFSHFESWRDMILEQEKIRCHDLKKKIQSEEDWLRYGVTARRKRNVRRVKELQETRAQFQEQKQLFQGKIKTNIQSSEQSGKLVIEADKITKTYNSLPVIKNFSLRVHYGERIGIVGPNGAGKTTLLKVLTGDIIPDSGFIRSGTNLKVSIIDQKREDLDLNMSLSSYITGNAGDSLIVHGQSRHVVGYIKDFLFQADQACVPLKNLSGGERMRAILARILSQPFNLLILDEPTNDLDFETLDFLEGIISNFQGTIFIVSHDRDFLDRTVKSILSPQNIDDPNGYWIKYAGGYSDMLLQQKDMQKMPQKKQTGKKHKPSTSSLSKKDTNYQNKSSLSYSQKILLEKIPQKIKEINLKIAANEEKIGNQTLFLNDKTEFYRLSHELETLYRELKEKEEEWFKLELLHEKGNESL